MKVHRENKTLKKNFHAFNAIRHVLCHRNGEPAKRLIHLKWSLLTSTNSFSICVKISFHFLTAYDQRCATLNECWFATEAGWHVFNSTHARKMNANAFLLRPQPVFLCYSSIEVIVIASLFLLTMLSVFDSIVCILVTFSLCSNSFPHSWSYLPIIFNRNITHTHTHFTHWHIATSLRTRKS